MRGEEVEEAEAIAMAVEGWGTAQGVAVVVVIRHSWVLSLHSVLC